jgi:hypothetical protein
VTSLAHERCFHHPPREAVARCPECGRVFCRECITEHDDRVLCAACLRKLAARPDTARARLTGLLRLGQCMVGVLVCWIYFYYVGRILLAIPSSFHEGTLWKTGSGNEEEP